MTVSTDARADQRLDLRGLKCPQPVLRARKVLRRLAPGAVLILECTDPLAAFDIPHLVRELGFDLQALERKESLLIFRIRSTSIA